MSLAGKLPVISICCLSTPLDRGEKLRCSRATPGDMHCVGAGGSVVTMELSLVDACVGDCGSCWHSSQTYHPSRPAGTGDAPDSPVPRLPPCCRKRSSTSVARCRSRPTASHRSASSGPRATCVLAPAWIARRRPTFATVTHVGAAASHQPASTHPPPIQAVRT